MEGLWPNAKPPAARPKQAIQPATQRLQRRADTASLAGAMAAPCCSLNCMREPDFNFFLRATDQRVLNCGHGLPQLRKNIRAELTRCQVCNAAGDIIDFKLSFASATEPARCVKSFAIFNGATPGYIYVYMRQVCVCL